MLALESSAKAASAALFEDGKMLAMSFADAGLTHSRTLLPMAEDLIKNLGRSVKELGAVAVAHGPGSFTGLRIGMAEAKGLCWALQIPAAGVSTLEAMAFGGMCGEDMLLCCAMDARRGQIYNALFAVQEGRPVRLTEDRAIAAADLEEELLSSKKTWLLLGDGAGLCYNEMERCRAQLRLAPEPLRLQNARGVGLAAQGKELLPGERLLPVYLRLSQAERERQKNLS